MDVDDIGILILYFVVIIAFITIITLPLYFGIDKTERENRCLEMPYEEYSKDTRCQKILED